MLSIPSRWRYQIAILEPDTVGVSNGIRRGGLRSRSLGPIFYVAIHLHPAYAIFFWIPVVPSDPMMVLDADIEVDMSTVRGSNGIWRYRDIRGCPPSSDIFIDIVYIKK